MKFNLQINVIFFARLSNVLRVFCDLIAIRLTLQTTNNCKSQSDDATRSIRIFSFLCSNIFRNTNLTGNHHPNCVFKLCGGLSNVAGPLIGRSLNKDDKIDTNEDFHYHIDVRGDFSKRDTTPCLECCSTEICNKDLCQHLKRILF